MRVCEHMRVRIRTCMFVCACVHIRECAHGNNTNNTNTNTITSSLNPTSLRALVTIS